MKHKIRIGISQGDINGISYEVIMKTLMDTRILEMCTPIVYGSPKVAAYHRKALNMNNFNFNNIHEATLKLTHGGQISSTASTTISGLNWENPPNLREKLPTWLWKDAVNDLKNGVIDALITAPINKDNIQSEKFNFPGHTEFLAEQFGTNNYLMLMVSEMMKIGVVTSHVPFQKYRN